ncbi:MAG: isoprenylcysteine carboxylmethyltransferase family protein, partial [Ancalomicrobiaceae bacterium]|nr:isoprenylcysteine carboxylmethyltransferase family protein [Ancalomicrobiaceae bacterium]
VLVTLKDRWTTRIIILRSPLVTTGPYRFVSHPNYMVVIGEIAALPLALGLPGFALLFSIANAAVLSVRIRAESAALNGGSDGILIADQQRTPT